MMMDERWSGQLRQGLDEMGLDLATETRQRLLAYLALLQKWNRAYNLTAIRDSGEMVSRQLLDSLSILPLLQGSRLLDVGTGAGLPGIPLAIARPDLHCCLLDSNGKKTRFVQQAIIELGLQEQVVVSQCRVEEYHSDTPFDTITSRAFADLPKMWRLSHHLLASGGLMLAMKGQLPREEMGFLQGLNLIVSECSLNVPGCAGQRHAILIRRQAGPE